MGKEFADAGGSSQSRSLIHIDPIGGIGDGGGGTFGEPSAS